MRLTLYGRADLRARCRFGDEAGWAWAFIFGLDTEGLRIQAHVMINQPAFSKSRLGSYGSS
jgi:hypothetical protein